MVASIYHLRMPVNLTQYCGAAGTFNTRRSIFQRRRKGFSFINCVNIKSFQNYSWSTFVFTVFVLLGLNHNGRKTSIKPFVLFLFLMGFLLKTFLWLQSVLVLLSSDAEINIGATRVPVRQAYQYAIGTWTVYLLTIMLNSLS